jgi:hypothetical protein
MGKKSKPEANSQFSGEGRSDCDDPNPLQRVLAVLRR